MRIIGLYGHSNCGKSASLTNLKELLHVAGRSLSAHPHPNSEMPETFAYKGLTVCVAPGGDNREILQSNIRYFKAKQCDVAISATRSKGASVDELNKFAASEGVRVEWIAKSYEYNLSTATQQMCNHETADVIFGRF